MLGEKDSIKDIKPVKGNEAEEFIKKIVLNAFYYISGAF
jgi:hypothetical protein